MCERRNESQGKVPVTRVRNLPESEQCLRYPGYRCNCHLKDEALRKKELRGLRQQLGGYSLNNLLDPGLAEMYELRKQQLCEGAPPTIRERIRDFLMIKLV